MKYALDTSVLIDQLRGYAPAVALFERLAAEEAELVSSYVVRTEVLSGMRRGEDRTTRELLDMIEWSPVGEPESEAAGALGRRFLRANQGIDTPDLLIAELAERQGAELLTTNTKHFREIIPGIQPPYTY
ncbi:MAG: PIN domain-containing protein [Chloroflexota bacterium]|nr:PIN domain-containing protein [Chloroflexota bacterium]